jgi:hypothetical protein
MWAVVLLTFAATPIGAQRTSQFDDLIPDLASKIASVLPAGTEINVTVVSLQGANDGGLATARVAALLTARGLRIVDAGAMTSISVSCSENLRERACLAEIRADDRRQIVTVTRPYDERLQAARAMPVAIELRPLFSQRTQILDVATIDRRILVLDANTLTLYEQTNGSWRSQQSRPISGSQVWPRDLRGRLSVSDERFDVLLPGVSCTGRLNPLDLTCNTRRQPWPFGLENTGLEPARNYFSTPEGLAFYGAAPVADADARWVLADRGGALQILDGARRVLATIGAADDVVALRGRCGPETYLVTASRTLNAEGSDALRLSQSIGRRLIESASPLILPGTLTALWALPDPTTATVVTHNVNAGRYDAYQASISCAR